MQIEGFDWDGSNRLKCQGHGVSIIEIESLFMQRHRITPDLQHSVDEERFLAIGHTMVGRPLFVVFTTRMERQNARSAHQRPLYACKGV